MAPDGADPCEGYHAIWDKNQKLKAQLESLKETITFYSKRSNYAWSSGGGYDQQDFKNEGAIYYSELLLKTFFSEELEK